MMDNICAGGGNPPNDEVNSQRSLEFAESQSKEVGMNYTNSIGTNTYILSNWSTEEINRVLGKNHPYRPTTEAKLIGNIDDHAPVHDEKRPTQTNISYNPKAMWLKAPVIAWLPGKNLEVLAFLLVWNLCIVLISGNSNLCGNYENYPTTRFCRQEYFLRDGSFIYLLGGTMFVLLAFRANQALELYQQCRQEWVKMTSAARSLTRQICFQVNTESEKDAWERRRAVGFVTAFVLTLKLQLRGQKNAVPDLGNILVHQDILNIQKSDSMPLICLDNVNYYLIDSLKSDKLSLEAMSCMEKSCMSTMVQAMGTLMDIKKLGSPASYSLHLRLIIIVFLLLLPFQLVASYGFYALLFAFIADFVVLGLDSMAADAESPFGNGVNDLDLDASCVDFIKDLDDTLVRVEHDDREQIFDTWEVTRMNEEMIYKATDKELKMLTSMQKVTKQGRAQCVRNATKGLWTESQDSYGTGTDFSTLSEA